METYTPNYYREFSCLMGACRHTCCAGWEIDIDEDAFERYQHMGGEIGRRLHDSIDVTPEGASFHLDAQERCPFLNSQGLCDLILETGEDNLCQICADHPRFRNEYADREEIGLGLCCEAAGKLILGWKDPVQLEEICDDGICDEPEEDELALIRWRNHLINIAQNQALTVYDRVKEIARCAEIPIPDAANCGWADFLCGLERLDDAWLVQLDRFKRWEKETSKPSCEADFLKICAFLTAEDRVMWRNAFEKLLVYLLYRHAPLALYDFDRKSYVRYVLLVWQVIHALCIMQAKTEKRIALDDIVEIVRMYSSEIEYSDENIGAIMEKFMD